MPFKSKEHRAAVMAALMMRLRARGVQVHDVAMQDKQGYGLDSIEVFAKRGKAGAHALRIFRQDYPKAKMTDLTIYHSQPVDELMKSQTSADFFKRARVWHAVDSIAAVRKRKQKVSADTLLLDMLYAGVKNPKQLAKRRLLHTRVLADPHRRSRKLIHLARVNRSKS